MKTTLLWIAVLPAAIIGYLIASLMINFTYSFWGNYDFGWNWLKLVNRFFLISAQSMGSAVMFVYIGMKVAPSHKRETGIFLIAANMTIMLMVEIITASLGYHLTTKDYVAGIFHLIGCVMAFAYLPEIPIIPVNKKEILDNTPSRLTPTQIAAFRKIYNAPDMPERVIIAKIQAVKQYKDSLASDVEE